MTVYFNHCLPAFDTDVHGNTGLQGIKKGIVVEVFLIYLIYLVVITMGTLKDKYKEGTITDFSKDYLISFFDLIH